MAEHEFARRTTASARRCTASPRNLCGLNEDGWWAHGLTRMTFEWLWVTMAEPLQLLLQRKVKICRQLVKPYAMKTTAQDKKQPMQSFKSRVLDQLWQAEPSELTRVKRLLNSFIKIGLLVGRDFIENLVKLQAMALAFKTLLSIAPFLAVIFSILKGFGVHNRIEPVLAEALAPLGEKGQEVTAHLIGFVDKMSAGALGSVGMVTLFITVLSLMGTIEQAFNTIWRVKAPRKLARKFSDYLSVLLVGPVLVFAALTVTATLQSNTFVRNLLALELLGTVILTLLRFGPLHHPLGSLYFFLSVYPQHAGQAALGGRRRFRCRDTLADCRLGVRNICRVIDQLLCDLLQLCHSPVVSSLVVCRLADYLVRSTSIPCAPAHPVFLWPS